MNTLAIRQHIQTVLAQENANRVLREHLNNLKKDTQKPAAAMDKLERKLLQLVQDLPDLLDHMLATAAQVGISPFVEPLLAAATAYFYEDQDLIPDHHGSFGLLDDTYFALSVVNKVSNLYQEQTGWPLVQLNLDKKLKRIRKVIGEDSSRQLEDLAQSNVVQVQQLLQQQAIQVALLQQYSGQVSPTGGQGAWGQSWEDEMVRVGAEAGVSFEDIYSGGGDWGF